LRHAGGLRDGSVTGFKAEQIGVGRGFAGRIYRLHLDYDRTEPGAPPTLIGKFSAEHVTTRAVMTELGTYFKEVRFYRELATEAGIPTPRCYMAHYDVEEQTFVLLLEDLSPAAAADIAVGLSVEQAKLVLQQVARMHARFWGRTAGLEWLAPTDVVVNVLRQRYLAALDAFAATFGERFPPLVKVARQIGWMFEGEEFMRELKRRPQTLTHGDLHIENILFPTAEGGRLAVVDWQLVMLSRYGASDVTRVLAMGLRPELRRAHEDELLRHYHAALQAHGVRRYSLRALKQRYRQEMGKELLVAVLAFDALDFAVDGGEVFAEMFLGRLNSALGDLETERLLARMILVIRPLRPFYNAYLAIVRRTARFRASRSNA
jgi:hypothetical protein